MIGRLLLSLLVLLLRPSFALGQSADHVSLARICASECGLNCAPAECAAIAEVIATRADMRHMRWATMARAYSSRVFDVNRSDGRRWIAGLRADGGEPHNWPTTVRVNGRDVPHAPWRSFRARWLSLLEAARGIIAGDIESPCATEVHHWGMRSGADWDRAVRAGWVLVDCGDTRNAFWRVP